MNWTPQLIAAALHGGKAMTQVALCNLHLGLPINLAERYQTAAIRNTAARQVTACAHLLAEHGLAEPWTPRIS